MRTDIRTWWSKKRSLLYNPLVTFEKELFKLDDGYLVIQSIFKEDDYADLTFYFVKADNPTKFRIFIEVPGDIADRLYDGIQREQLNHIEFIQWLDVELAQHHIRSRNA